MQWRVLQKLRATPLDPSMWCFANPGMKFLDQARLAEPRLAHDEHQLPITKPSAVPAPHKYRYFLVATDKRREMALACATSATARPYQPEQRHRLRHAFQFIGAALLGDKQTSDLALHRRCQQDGAGLCQRLHPRGSVGRVAVNLPHR